MFNYSSDYLTDTLADFAINCEVNLQTHHLVNDSRLVQTGDIFCAVQGSQQSGQQYIEQAINAGAVVVLKEIAQQSQHGDVAWQQVSNTDDRMIAIISFYQLNHHLFALAKSYYQQPQNKMTMIGITGTNGKTSTCQLIAQLLDACNKPCGVIGTNGAGRVGQLTDITNTTPGATELHQLFADFNQQTLQCVAMEVSSHALEQRRVTADLFDIAVFTNLSRDHLDYHQTMEKYAAAKALIFSPNNEKQISVINGDDQQAKKWLVERKDQTQNLIVFGRSEPVTQYPCFVYAFNLQHHHHGVTFSLKTHLGECTIDSPLMADFNVDNLLAAIAVLMTQNVSLAEISQNIKQLNAITGRMESFTSAKNATAIVDYAHTPDALENALKACHQHCQGQLWVVFGCGGDRDKGKRALMGQVAEKWADHIVITNDNPRSEDPVAIANDILTGCKKPEKITVLLAREQAVLTTLKRAKAKDFVLFAGKGHEDYIIVGNETLAYNERAVVNKFYQNGAIL